MENSRLGVANVWMSVILQHYNAAELKLFSEITTVIAIFLLLQRHRDPRFFVFFSLVSVFPSVRCCVQSQTWAVCDESVLWESVCGHTGLCWLTLYPALKHTRSQKPESNEKLSTERSKHCTVFRGGRWNVQMQCIWEINEPSFQLKGQQASG